MDLFQVWLFLTVTLRERFRQALAVVISFLGLWLFIDGGRGGDLDTRSDFDPQRFFLGLALLVLAAFILRSRPRPFAKQARIIAHYGSEPKRPWRRDTPPQSS